jgi:GTP-binding protein
MATPVLELVATSYLPNQFPTASEPEIVMVGRSNVGKSSLINQLAGKASRLKIKQSARVSQKPGCTRSINFYRFGAGKTLVDLPGFGYAQLPVRQREKLKELVEAYFEKRSTIALVVHIVDARLELQALDWQMLEWVQHFRYPYLLLLNKCDKLSRSLLFRREREMQQDLRMKYPEVQSLAVSALTGHGITECKKSIKNAIDKYHERQ